MQLENLEDDLHKQLEEESEAGETDDSTHEAGATTKDIKDTDMLTKCNKKVSFYKDCKIYPTPKCK